MKPERVFARATVDAAVQDPGRNTLQSLASLAGRLEAEAYWLGYQIDPRTLKVEISDTAAGKLEIYLTARKLKTKGKKK